MNQSTNNRAHKTSNTGKKLTASIVAVVVLTICLCITSYALVLSMVSVNNHYFHTGSVDINLNDGKPVIKEHEFLFEPGMTVKKEFFIENESTWNVYYKIYFENVKGGLSDVLEITICDGETILFEGTAATLTQQNVSTAMDVLRMNERRELTIYFHFPEEKGNEAQNQMLTFDMCAQAVQTKNNPDRVFE